MDGIRFASEFGNLCLELAKLEGEFGQRLSFSEYRGRILIINSNSRFLLKGPISV